jgi:hypothetical protein
MDKEPFHSIPGDGPENPAPAAAIAVTPLLLAEAVFALKNTCEHDASASASLDNAAVLERLISLAAGFDGDECVLAWKIDPSSGVIGVQL